jgi:hypothetical protein
MISWVYLCFGYLIKIFLYLGRIGSRFGEKFARMNTIRELPSTADSLEWKPLVDLTGRTLAQIIEERYLQEEKLETLKNVDYVQKRQKELHKHQKLKVILMDFTYFACFDVSCPTQWCLYRLSSWFSHYILHVRFWFWVCFRTFKYSKSKKVNDLWICYYCVL